MPTFAASYPALVDALAEHYGPPAGAATVGDPFEAVLAAFLEQQLEPRKVRALLDAWRDAGLLTPEDLAAADPAELVEAARAGGVTLATRAVPPLRRLARAVAEAGVGAWSQRPTESLREDLRAIPGVGPGAADAILLHGLGRPVYPVDRASYRILARHGWLDPSADYDEASEALRAASPDDPAALARLSAWFERVGRDFCRPASARCDRCPLRPYLPDGGPREPSD